MEKKKMVEYGATGVVIVTFLLALLMFATAGNAFSLFGFTLPGASVYGENVVSSFTYHVEKSASGRCDNYDYQNIFIYNPNNIAVKSYTVKSTVIGVAGGLCYSCYIGGTTVPSSAYTYTSNIIYDTTDNNKGNEFKVTWNELGNLPNTCRTDWVVDYVMDDNLPPPPPPPPTCTKITGQICDPITRQIIQINDMCLPDGWTLDTTQCTVIIQPPTCRVYSAPSPDFCKGGVITPGQKDSDGCVGPPSCEGLGIFESIGNVISSFIKSIQNFITNLGR